MKNIRFLFLALALASALPSQAQDLADKIAAVSFYKYASESLTVYAKNVDSYSRTYSYSVAIMVGYK